MSSRKVYLPLAPTITDNYKREHDALIDESVGWIQSNITPRSFKYFPRLPDFDGKATLVGLHRTICTVNEYYNEFFDTPWAEARDRLDYELRETVMGNANFENLLQMYKKLHALQHLPLEIRGLPEGTRVPMKVPVATLVNTNPDQKYLTNYVEPFVNSELWKTVVNASTAYEFLRFLSAAALKTTGSTDGVEYQAHDFSSRGMSGALDAAYSSIAHVSCFKGSDTTSVTGVVKHFYKTHPNELISVAPPATEHMIMSLGGQQGEVGTYRKVWVEKYGTGIASIVSDTWDFWHIITVTAAELKDEILARQPDRNGVPAKAVFRPDSGDPVKIVCGDPDAPFGSPAYKGAVECLDEIFGHEVSPQGYKILNPKVGVIYGDSITLERAVAIIKGLMAKGYASTNIVFGIGSFTYQMVSRDTFSIATKATWARRLDGSVFNLAKDPITDPGKKSATGYLSVRGRKEYSRIENDPNLIIKPAGEFYTDLELVENVDDRVEGNILNVMLRNSVVAESPYWSDITDRISAQARLQGCDLEALGIF